MYLFCSSNRWSVYDTFLHTCVGVMWLMSSDASCLSKVVFPPLSRPSSSILTSWSGVLFSLRRMESNPCNNNWEQPCDVTVTLPGGRGSTVEANHHCRNTSLPSIHPDPSLIGRGSAFILWWASTNLIYEDNKNSCEWILTPSLVLLSLVASVQG